MWTSIDGAANALCSWRRLLGRSGLVPCAMSAGSGSRWLPVLTSSARNIFQHSWAMFVLLMHSGSHEHCFRQGDAESCLHAHTWRGSSDRMTVAGLGQRRQDNPSGVNSVMANPWAECTFKSEFTVLSGQARPRPSPPSGPVAAQQNSSMHHFLIFNTRTTRSGGCIYFSIIYVHSRQQQNRVFIPREQQGASLYYLAMQSIL
jgi:hypothetical protein